MMTQIVPYNQRKPRSSSIVNHILNQNNDPSMVNHSNVAPWYRTYLQWFTYQNFQKSWGKSKKLFITLHNYCLSIKTMDPDILNEYTVDQFFERGVEFSWSLGILLASLWWPFIFLGWSISNCILICLRLYRICHHSIKYKQAYVSFIHYYTFLFIHDNTVATLSSPSVPPTYPNENINYFIHHTITIYLFLQSLMAFPIAIFLITSIIPSTVNLTSTSINTDTSSKLTTLLSILEPYVLPCLLLPPVTAMIIEFLSIHTGMILMAYRIYRDICTIIANRTNDNSSSTSSSQSILPSIWKIMTSIYPYVRRILWLRIYSYFLAIMCILIYFILVNPGPGIGKTLVQLTFGLLGMFIIILGIITLGIFIIWLKSQKTFLKQSWDHETLLEEEENLALEQQQQQQRGNEGIIRMSNPMHNQVRSSTGPRNTDTVPHHPPSSTVYSRLRSWWFHHRLPANIITNTPFTPITVRPPLVRERTKLYLDTLRKNNSLLCTYWFTTCMLTIISSFLFLELYTMNYEPFTTLNNLNTIIDTIINYDINYPINISNKALSRFIRPSTKIIGYYLGIQLISMTGLVLLARTIQELWDSEDEFSRWISRNTLMNNQQYQRLTKLEEENSYGVRVPLYLEKLPNGNYHRTNEDKKIFSYGIQIIPNPIHELQSILNNATTTKDKLENNVNSMAESKEVSNLIVHHPIVHPNNERESPTYQFPSGMIDNIDTFINTSPTTVSPIVTPSSANLNINNRLKDLWCVKLPITSSIDEISNQVPALSSPMVYSSRDKHTSILSIPAEDTPENTITPITTIVSTNNVNGTIEEGTSIPVISPRPRLLLSKVTNLQTSLPFRRNNINTPITSIATVAGSSLSSSSINTLPHHIPSEIIVQHPTNNIDHSYYQRSTTKAVVIDPSHHSHSTIPTISTTNLVSNTPVLPPTYTARIQHRGHCFICYERLANCVFMECGHSGICYPCAEIIYYGNLNHDQLMENNRYPTRNTYNNNSQISYHDFDNEGIPPELLYDDDSITQRTSTISIRPPHIIPLPLPIRTGGSRICPICRGPVSQILHIGPDIQTVDGKIITIVLPRQYWETK